MKASKFSGAQKAFILKPAYASILATASGEASPPDPGKLIVPMLVRFMETHRGFVKARRDSSAG